MGMSKMRKWRPEMDNGLREGLTRRNGPGAPEGTRFVDRRPALAQVNRRIQFEVQHGFGGDSDILITGKGSKPRPRTCSCKPTDQQADAASGNTAD